MACPGGIGETLTLPKQTSTIGPDALAGITTLKSIVVLGNITTIDPTAFNDQTKQSTTIALPGGEDYETRKQVWQQAGFKNFATPANPGDTQTPDQPSNPGDKPNNPTDPSKPTSGFTYKLLEDYTLEASWTGELSPESTPIIPATAQLSGVSYAVSALAPSAFENQTALTAITLPNSLTNIGSRAFAGTGLAALDIPASITTIGDQAFANCPNLTRLITHTNALTVAPTALEGCTNLELWCPYNEAETYPWILGIFSSNNHVKAYGLPASQQALTLEVGQSANLFEPGTLQAPDPAKPVYAYEATCLSVSQEGIITAKAPGTTTVTTTLILDDVALAEIICTLEMSEPLPLAATPIGPQANLSPRTLLAPAGKTGVMPLVTGDSFDYNAAPVGQPEQWLRCTVLTEAGGLTGTVEVAMQSNTLSGDLKIPSQIINGGITYTVIQISDSGFYNSLISSVTFPDTITTVGNNSFAWCTKLTSLTLPKNDSYKYIEYATFAWCLSLSTISSPGNITAFNSDAFYGAPTETVNLILPKEVVWGVDYETRSGIWFNWRGSGGQRFVKESDAFVLPAVTTGKSIPLTYVPLTEDSASKTGTVLVARKDIADTSLSGDLTIPEEVVNKGITYRVTTIGSSAFRLCNSLQSVTLPEAIEHLKTYSFSECHLLSSINLPNALTAIDDYSFCETALGFVDIPDNVVFIGVAAFYNASLLEMVVLPANSALGIIQVAAFGNCFKLTSIISPGNITSIHPDAFRAMDTKNVTVALPAGNVWGKDYEARKAIWSTWEGIPSTQKFVSFAKLEDPHAVTFNTNGGAPAPAAQSVLPAVKVAKPAVDPTKPNSTFAGWYEDQGAWQKPWDFERNLMPPNDIALYARWTHNVAFNTNGGIPSAINPLTVDDNIAVSSPPDPSKTGYTFGGWYADAACTEANKWDFTKPVTAHLSLYAKWNLVISVDVPIEQSFSIDAKGGITSATTPEASFFASHTVEPLRVSEIACTKGTGADKIFMKTTDTNRIKITMAAGTPATAAEIPLTGKWTQPANPSPNLFPLPVKGKLDVTFGLIIPPDASYTYNATDPGTFATLTYKIEPA
ncbi:MAG: leucine-rich repeat protein [Raoultibacter sp.]